MKPFFPFKLPYMFMSEYHKYGKTLIKYEYRLSLQANMLQATEFLKGSAHVTTFTAAKILELGKTIIFETRRKLNYAGVQASNFFYDVCFEKLAKTFFSF